MENNYYQVQLICEITDTMHRGPRIQHLEFKKLRS